MAIIFRMNHSYVRPRTLNCPLKGQVGREVYSARMVVLIELLSLCSIISKYLSTITFSRTIPILGPSAHTSPKTHVGKYSMICYYIVVIYISVLSRTNLFPKNLWTGIIPLHKNDYLVIRSILWIVFSGLFSIRIVCILKNILHFYHNEYMCSVFNSIKY